eukprot:236239-Hanusia_phi.AAC.1
MDERANLDTRMMASSALFYFYDEDEDDRLSRNEILAFLRDLCSAEDHVMWCLHAIGLGEGTELTKQEFFRLISDKRKMQSIGLKTRGLRSRRFLGTYSRQAPDSRAPPKVVLDPRQALASNEASSCPEATSTWIGPSAVNKEFLLDPSLASEGDWRGCFAAPRGSIEHSIASGVVSQMQTLALRMRLDLQDVADEKWERDGSLLSRMLKVDKTGGQADRIMILMAACKTIVSSQPTLVHVSAPCKVIGDVHGQLRDILLLLGSFGFPSHYGGDIESTAYIFNGDWVDRGCHQLEVVVFLCALKILYPHKIFLVRGNHEFQSQNEFMGSLGFHQACITALGEQEGGKVYQSVHEVFSWLPLSALIEDSILTLHGGLGDGSWGLSNLSDDIPRPLRNEVLWSDPTDSDHFMAHGVHPSPRGKQLITHTNLRSRHHTHVLLERTDPDASVFSVSYGLINASKTGIRSCMAGDSVCLLLPKGAYSSPKPLDYLVLCTKLCFRCTLLATRRPGSNDGALLLVAYDENVRRIASLRCLKCGALTGSSARATKATTALQFHLRGSGFVQVSLTPLFFPE